MDYLIAKEPEKSNYLIEPEPETPAQPQGLVSKAKDTAVSFGIGANSLLQMAGDFYGLATGDMGNVVSQQAKENIQYLQQRKSPELRQAEEARRKAIEADEDELGKALTYVRQTVTNPSLLSNALAEQVPNLVGTGGAGALAKAGAEKVLLKTAADQAAKRLAAKKAAQIGTGAAVGAGAAMQGTDVGADLYDEAVSALDKITDEQAMSIPEIASLMEEKKATLDEAKTAFALALGREAFALGATVSAGAQMLPGGRTIERAFVGKQAGRRLAGAITGGLGEAASEAVEEGGSRVAANLLARQFEPDRPLAKGVGEAVGQAAVVGGIPGAAFGAASSRPTTQPAPEGQTTAGKTGEAPASAATKSAIAGAPEVALESSEGLTPEQFYAAVNIRQARLMGGKPDPEDIRIAGEVPLPKVQIDPEKANRAIEEAQSALQEWVSSTPNAPQTVEVIFDPELLHNGYGVQGYYKDDGTIAINAAFVSPDRVASIASHEWAHQTLATPEGQQAFADFVQREIPQAELDALAARYKTQDRRVLLEEWIAQNQEKAPGVIERIVARIREWLAGVGIVDLSDAEVADIMLRTLRQQAENRIQPDIYESMQPAQGERLSLSETGRAPELTPPAEILTRIQDEPAKPGRPVPKSRFYVPSVERGRDFADAIARAAQDHPRGAAVEVKPPEFYSDPENFLFFAPDGLAGAAVKPDGDLVSVFKHPTSKTRMKEVLADAAERAIKLDAFDIDSYLPQLYSNFGFRPVARVAFNEEFAPPRWNFDDMGRPDVILMVKDPDNILGLPDSTLYTDEVRQQVPLVSYEEAMRLQQEAVDKLKQAGVKFSLTEQVAKGRDPVLAAEAQKLKRGETTPAKYARKVEQRMPLRPFEEVPEPATDEDILRGLANRMAGETLKRELKANPEDIEGQQVEARLDIPSYEDANVWTVTLHLPRERAGAAGKVLAYTPTAILRDVSFTVNETAAMNVAAGARKSSFATMDGTYVPATARSAYEQAVEAKESGDWVEIGMNPIRHSYFYDKADQRPVVSAEEVIQVGGLVLGRGVQYGEKSDRKFSLSEEPVEQPVEETDEEIETEDPNLVLSAEAERERPDLPPTSALNTLYAQKSAISVPETGKRTNGQVAEQLRQAALKHWGRKLDSSNLNADEIERIVDNGVEEVIAGLKASNHAGNWYTTAIRKAMAIAAVLHPELSNDALAQKAGFKDAKAAEVGLSLAMAITSQNLNVEKNTEYANEQFRILKETGRFDPSKEYGSKMEAISGNLRLANTLLDKVGWEGAEEFLNREYTVKELNEIASQVLGEDVSIAGKVDDLVNGSAIFGPKIGGGFFQNLRANFNPVTVDLWMRRTWGRWTGDVLPEPLNAPRLARMLEGMREAGIQLPEQLRSIRTVLATEGRKVPTLTDKAAQRILSDPAKVNAAYDFAAEQDSRWNKMYSEVRQNITPEQAAAVRAGELSLEQLNRLQQKSIREKRDAWQSQEDRPSGSSKEGRDAQKKFFEEMDAKAGRTAKLTNKELSKYKPEWAKSSRVITTLLKPVDVPSDLDRRVIVDVVNRIRAELQNQGVNATNADIQAILWYPEKDIWAKLAGKKESKLKSSYDEEFLRVAEAQGLGSEARDAAGRVGD